MVALPGRLTQEDEVDEVGPLCSWERMTRSVDLAHSLRKLQHSSMEVTKQKCVASWRSISTDDTWQRRRRKPPVHKQLAFVNAGAFAMLSWMLEGREVWVNADKLPRSGRGVLLYHVCK